MIRKTVYIFINNSEELSVGTGMPREALSPVLLYVSPGSLYPFPLTTQGGQIAPLVNDRFGANIGLATTKVKPC